MLTRDRIIDGCQPYLPVPNKDEFWKQVNE